MDDFVQDRTHDGRAFCKLTVIDEYTRECLAIKAGRQMTANDGLDVLARLFIEYGPPDHVRTDRGAEFTAVRVRAWLAELDVKTAFIEKGSVNADVGRAARELVERHGSNAWPWCGSAWTRSCGQGTNRCWRWR